VFYGAVTVGERGQVVIPAEARKDQEIEPATKLLVFTDAHHHGLLLIKADDIHSLVSSLQGLLESIRSEEAEA